MLSEDLFSFFIASLPLKKVFQTNKFDQVHRDIIRVYLVVHCTRIDEFARSSVFKRILLDFPIPRYPLGWADPVVDTIDRWWLLRRVGLVFWRL